MTTTQPRVYQPDAGWLDDLRVCVKQRRMSVTEAAAATGLSRATAYRIIKQARAEGDW